MAVAVMVGMTVGTSSARPGDANPPVAPTPPATGNGIPLVVGAVPYWDEEEARKQSKPTATDRTWPRHGRTRSRGTVPSCCNPICDAGGEEALAAASVSWASRSFRPWPIPQRDYGTRQQSHG